MGEETKKGKTVLLIHFKNGTTDKREEGSVSMLSDDREITSIPQIRDFILGVFNVQRVFTLILEEGLREKSYNPRAIQSIEIMDNDTYLKRKRS